ncbi:hypothetical protein [uncultured Enterococcus sp.]|uniref:hypothetical protein n=1 Tax=uncultured Enterococcus sp. TaxID=167972 RepID=UPI002AA8FAF0|nr:hypothetical protein [uncultured Enterococcus sp.]
MSKELFNKLLSELQYFCKHQKEIRRELQNRNIVITEIKPNNEQEAVLVSLFLELNKIEKEIRSIFQK